MDVWPVADSKVKFAAAANIHSSVPSELLHWLCHSAVNVVVVIIIIVTVHCY